MLWNSIIELDSLISLIMIIVYGLISLRNKLIDIGNTFIFLRIMPILWVIFFTEPMGNWHNNIITNLVNGNIWCGIEILLALSVTLILFSFKSLEAGLLVLLAFFFQYYMLHSTDLLSFFITLEAQNFCFFVLCGMYAFMHSNSHNTSKSVEIGLKYLLLSAFSSGILLYGTSLLYLQTGSISIASFTQTFVGGVSAIKGYSPQLYELSGIAHDSTTLSIEPSGSMHRGLQGGLSPSNLGCDNNTQVGGEGIQYFFENFLGNTQNVVSCLILCSILFKLGIAPFHLWMYEIYSSTHRVLILYITTIPKLCLISFWIMHLQGIISNYSLLIFSLFSGIIGSTAYVQPNIRNLLVYSSISEIGLLVAALETAGYNALIQHLSIYIVSQFLLWNIQSTNGQVNRIMPILAVSLAGIPPLAGFFGKAWILWHLSTINATALLILSLSFAFISVIFYLRIVRLSWSASSRAFLSIASNKHCFSLSLLSNSSYPAVSGAIFSGDSPTHQSPLLTQSTNAPNSSNGSLLLPNLTMGNSAATIKITNNPVRTNGVLLTTTCVILLIIIPFFVLY